MLAIIGTYRGMDYVPDLLQSIDEHVIGITRLVFVDDSNDLQTASKLTAWGEVVQTFGKGYNAAMQAVTARGAQENDHAIFLEEDFTFTGAVDFLSLADHLDTHPHLSQIVLQREPWFAAEKEYNSLVDFHRAKGHTFRDANGFWEHTAFFSCNPAIWHRETWAAGWPEGEWSEDQKRREELARHKRFAFTKDVLVEHHGIRSGTGY